MYQCIEEIDTDLKHAYVGRFDKAGDEVERHWHDQYHLAVVMQGIVHFELWHPHNPEGTLKKAGGPAPQFIDVPAGWMHRAVARTDGAMTACIFDRYDRDGNLLPDPKSSRNPP